MKPKISQLNCITSFLSELSVRTNPLHDPEKEIFLDFEKLDIDSTIVEIENGDGHFQVVLSIKQDAASMENSPYSYSVEMIGIFEAGGIPEDIRQEFIRVNGSSILFGMVRETLRATMARGPFIPIQLPLVSFYVPKKEEDGSAPKKRSTRKKVKTEKKRNSRARN